MASFSRGFGHFLADGLFCDLVLRVGANGSDRREFQCHQLIAAYSSPLLSRRIREADPSSVVDGRLVLDVDVPDPKALKHFDKIIDYMYKGSTSLNLFRGIELLRAGFPR